MTPSENLTPVDCAFLETKNLLTNISRHRELRAKHPNLVTTFIKWLTPYTRVVGPQIIVAVSVSNGERLKGFSYNAIFTKTDDAIAIRQGITKISGGSDMFFRRDGEAVNFEGNDQLLNEYIQFLTTLRNGGGFVHPSRETIAVMRLEPNYRLSLRQRPRVIN